ncbi:NUDIX domain-containing protein [Candidatus Saccharibacteria bacterium]|jgi:diadenosine hexaphosphate hydrolase (ATP-forming)|nr:MAG: NUDIX domain-containing protein [Candidatus Saccharibacteria bacterium]
MMKRPKPLQRFKKIVTRAPAINEVVRERTAGGVIFRRNKTTNQIEILLTADAKDRWTIPKGHIEEGESPRQTAEREITEETGLQKMKIIGWLNKVSFQYRRNQSLVLMTTEVFLVQALGDTDALNPEEWMNGIRWFSVNEALDKIEYEDIGKAILIGLKKIRSAGL